MRLGNLPLEVRGSALWLESVPWCEYVNEIIIPEGRGRFGFRFRLQFDSWKGDWTILEYAATVRAIVRESRGLGWSASEDELDIAFDGFVIAVGPSRKRETVRENIDRLGPIIADVHAAAQRRLQQEANRGSVVVRFDFPEAVKVPCEQYLVYFADFLKDVGVNADTTVTSSAGHVLFSVTPDGPEDALGRVRQALSLYLTLPGSPIADVPHADFAAQRLLANVRHLEGQLALAQAVMYAQQASIKAQETTIENQQQIMTGEIISASVVAEDREELLGGTVAVTKYEGKGFEVNIPEILRKIRKIMTSRRSTPERRS
jgi:hypothetical protein